MARNKQEDPVAGEDALPKPTAKALQATSGDEAELTVPPGILAGAEDPSFADGKNHISLAIMLKSSSGPTTLMIPDATGTAKKCFITRPIKLELGRLKTYLEKKDIKLPEQLGNVLTESEISCEALYYSSGPFLMMFSVTINKGLIATLTGDADLGDMFDLTGASIRVVRYPKGEFKVLEDYVAELTA
jgi:hypothetical protein